MYDRDSFFGNVIVILLTVLGIATLIGALMWILPIYNVWSKGKSGEAALRQAENERKVLIETAKARKESEILKAEGEEEAAAIRARAIEVIGEAAKQYPEYREQEFIGGFADALRDGNIHQIIYIPTEANIPIIEAGSR